ncbi:MAG: hypothetical protein ACOCM0_03345 [Campylobacter hyointestinalis]
MDKNDGLNELVLPEGKSRQAFLVYLKIIFLPILIYAIFFQCYKIQYPASHSHNDGSHFIYSYDLC